MTASPEKSQLSATHSTQKHSMPFYISTSLFHNKRLKHKRCKWAAATVDSASASTSSAAAKHNSKGAINNNYHHQRTKTDERCKQNQSKLQAEVTIDLLSDEDDVDANSASISKCMEEMNAHAFIAMEEQLQQLQNKNHKQQQHFLVYPGHLQISQVPNITLVPVVPTTNINHATATLQTSAQKQRVKRKRKAHQPKRLSQPTIINNESIVLSDDSDMEANTSPVATSTPTPFAAASTTTISPTSTTLAPFDVVTSKPLLQSPPCSTAKSSTTNATYSAQVDEEVTVSIVPRSSAAGSCSSSSVKKQTSPDELFPMLPDETTVHTVIANRIYELSLTKLREGLASCGIPEFQTNGGPQVSPTRRKGAQITTPPLAIPPPTPISLKLSSDLSISLISDDEDDEQLQQQLSAEKFLQKQPQLSVQQLQLPVLPVSMDGHYVAPRRRKLG